MLFLPKFTSGWTLVEKSPISEVHIQKLVFLLFLYGTYQHGPAEFSAKKMAGQLYLWKWLDKISPNDLNNSKIIFLFQSFSLLSKESLQTLLNMYVRKSPWRVHQSLLNMVELDWSVKHWNDAFTTMQCNQAFKKS